MFSRSLKQKAQKLLTQADIEINGSRPWDIHVHNESFFPRVFSKGALGLGESYMDGWWDCKQLDVFFDHILRSEIDRDFRVNLSAILNYLKALILNLQRGKRAYKVGEEHYDLDKDLYQAMLDDRMVYTPGYWRNAGSLDAATEAKLNLVCQKLDLKPGQTVLDIGCGWGSFARYAAEKYDAEVTGVTVSKEQVALARQMCGGLPVNIMLEDYRKVEGTFDHIVSLGMFEHVGYKNYGTFIKVAREHVKAGGRFLLHTIGGNRSVHTTNAWTTKYIFPNSMLPSIRQIGDAIEKHFVMEDWQNFGHFYDKTLMAWYDNFNEAWPTLKQKYSDRFYRMWKYYLLSSAGGFRSRRLQSWQILFSPHGIPGGFIPPRYRTQQSEKTMANGAGKASVHSS